MQSLHSADGVTAGGEPARRSPSFARAAALRSKAAGLALAAILAVAAYLRLASPDHAQMAGDQSVILGMALRFVKGGPLPLAGIKSSAGIMMPPMTEYLLAVPLFFKQAIQPVVTFNALLGFLAVAVCAWVTVRLAGWRAGLIATLLFAASPWSIHYARFFWNQNFVPLFSTLAVGLLLLYFAGPQRRPIYLSLALLCVAVVIQLHLAALVLLLVLGMALLLFWRQVSPRHLALGVGLFVLSFLPYLLYMRVTGFADLKAMFGALGAQEADLNLASFLIMGDLATGHGLVEAWPQWVGAVWPWHGLSRLAGWLFVASLAYAAGYLLLCTWRRRQGKPFPALGRALAILLLWTIVPALCYVRHTVYLQNYYLIYLLPTPFILMGIAVDRVLRLVKAVVAGRRPPWLRVGYYAMAAALLGVVVVLAVWQFQISYVRLALEEQRVLDQRQAGDMDRLIGAMRRVTAQEPDCGLVVVSEGHTADASPYGLLADFGSGVRYVQDGRGLIIPAGCATYLDTTGSGWLQSWLGDNLTEMAGEEVQAGGQTWRFYRKSATPAPGGEPLGEWANGVRLRECRLQGSLVRGGAAELTLVWEASRPSDGRVYHFFNHLVYRQDGQMVSQEDGPGVHSPYWQAGDLFVTRFAIPIPEDAPTGQYEVRVGMYGLAGLERVPLVDGTDALPAVTLDLAEG